MKRRILAGLFLAVVLCTVLPGCGGRSGQGADPGAGGEPGGESQADNAITVGIAQQLDNSLDPHLTVLAGTREVMFNVFEGLMKPTSDGELIDAVAQSHEVSEDGTVYTFTLREGILFHSGAAVTADDVVYSIARCADAEGGKTPLVEAFSNIRSVAAVDEATVVITLNAPDSEFLTYLTTAVLPADYDRQDTAPIGTGPFRFVSRFDAGGTGDDLVLERFDGYWGVPAALDRVAFRVFESGDAMVLALQSGAIDLCAHLTPTQAAQLGPEYRVESGLMNLVQALYLNNARAPFDDVRVRQALCYAVDRQEVIDLAGGGNGQAVGSSIYPKLKTYFDDSLTDYYTRDVERAKALLTEAGYPDGFDMTITVPASYTPHMDAAQVLVEQLAAIGVRASIDPVEMTAWSQTVYTDRDFQSTVVGVDAAAMTARAMLERFTSDYSRNFINYKNSDYDALFDQAMAAADRAAQIAAYRDMARNLTENAANVYLQDLGDLVAVRAELSGYVFYPIYVMDLSGVAFTA